jgi:hypothetical protein
LSDYVVTSAVGDNSDLFPKVAKLYIPKKSRVLDTTWGNGVFWKKMDLKEFDVYQNDLDPERGKYHYDFRSLPEAWDGIFDAVIIDPPYLYTGGFKTLKTSIDKGYNNKARNEMGIHGVDAVDKLYYDGMKESYRLLKPKGILIVKCQDQVMSGKQVWGHVTYMNYAEKIGFENEDLFVLVQKNQPTMRHKPEQQKHARRNHSYFLVFRKKCKK